MSLWENEVGLFDFLKAPTMSICGSDALQDLTWIFSRPFAVIEHLPREYFWEGIFARDY